MAAVLVLLAILSFSREKTKTDGKQKVAYLAAYMKGDDENHLYYALADSDFLFKPLNGGKPVLSASYCDRLLRDPMILRDKQGLYHLVATVSWSKRPFTVWDSHDLIHWENERLVDVAPQGASKTWAPEFCYDHEADTYMVYWTAELNEDWSTAAIYFATTDDFVHFSTPSLLYKDDEGVLDANITRIGDTYYLVYRKDGIWVASSQHAQGPYGHKYLLTDENVEGPFVFPLNYGGGWGIVWDYFGGSRGFGLWTSPDFCQWTRVTNSSEPFYNEKVAFPPGIRHGSILGLTSEERDALLQEYGFR